MPRDFPAHLTVHGETIDLKNPNRRSGVRPGFLFRVIQCASADKDPAQSFGQLESGVDFPGAVCCFNGNGYVLGALTNELSQPGEFERFSLFDLIVVCRIAEDQRNNPEVNEVTFMNAGKALDEFQPNSEIPGCERCVLAR